MMKMKKRIVSLTAALLLLAAVTVSAPVEAYAGAAGDVRNSVAPIAIMLEFADPWSRESLGMMSLGSGTCFFVGEGEGEPENLVTNYHVAQYYLEYGKGDWIDDIVTIEGVRTKVIERVTMRVYLNKNEYTL